MNEERTREEHTAVERSVHTLLKVTSKDKIDILLDYLRDKTGNHPKISKLMREQLKRIETAQDLIEKHKLLNVVETILIKKFNYSQSTARRDIESAKTIFGAGTVDHRKWKKHFYTNWLEEVARKAERRGDFKSFASIMDKVIKLQDFDKAEELDDSILEAPPTMIINYDLNSLGLDPLENIEVLKERLRYKKAKEIKVEEAEIVDEENS